VTAGYRLFFPERPEWDVQAMRLAAQAVFGGSDVFECLATAHRIRRGELTEEAWRRGWRSLAEGLLGNPQTDGVAEWASRRTQGQRAARASSYFRTAEFFAPHNSELRRDLFDQARAAFRAAIPELPIEVEVIAVADEAVEYDGYVFYGRSAAPERPQPAVIFLGGADSYAEELFFFGGSALAERGLTVVVADTPGRGSTLRHKGIISRPDYEVPAARLVDYAASLAVVDPDRIGLVGLSLGGYYAPRLAAFDERIKACVCWCACVDVLEDVYLFYPAIQPQLRWIVGAANDMEARERLAAFRLDEVAPQITCPILISHGEADEIMAVRSARRLYELVGSADKHLRIWTQAEGGAGHCNYDNWAACIPLMFDWLVSRLDAA
jgi:dipeptidyl aminopeptidase/acylaminoacyl peptidase